MRLGGLRHALARIGDGYANVAAGLDLHVLLSIVFAELGDSRFDRDPPAARHCIAGVHNQIDDNLLDLARVRSHGSRGRIQQENKFDILADQPAQHVTHAADHRIDVEQRRMRHLAAAERE